MKDVRFVLMYQFVYDTADSGYQLIHMGSKDECLEMMGDPDLMEKVIPVNPFSFVVSDIQLSLTASYKH